MTLPTFEEAKLCPKCSKPGEDMLTQPAPNLPKGTKIHTIYCRNELCPWFNTCWMVQVNPDGSVPAPKNHTGEPKLYAGFEEHDEYAERLLAGLKAQQAAEIKPGAEIRKR